MNERLRELRKTLRLTQEEFSQKVGIKRNTFANYEIGRNTPIDAVLFSICSVFNVNENWLRYGQGEMFMETKESFISGLLKQYDLDNLDRSILESYISLSVDDRSVIKKYIHSISESLNYEIATTVDATLDGNNDLVKDEGNSDLFSLFLKLDSDNREIATAVLTGMFMVQEVDKGNPIDFSSL